MKILDQEENLLAYIIRFEDIKEGKNFITSNDAEFQLASFNLSDDTVIERHYHPKQESTPWETSMPITQNHGGSISKR